MTNETSTKEIEKSFSVIKNDEVTNEQLLEKLASVENLLVKINQKLSKPLIS